MVTPQERETNRDLDRSRVSTSEPLEARAETEKSILERLGAGVFVMRRVVLPWMGLVVAVFIGGWIGMGPCGFLTFAVWHDFCRRSRAVQRVAHSARGAVFGGGAKLA